MGYWPSYSTIGPNERAAYLDWLVSGRCNPNAYIGYVFLYFYGLERRVLAEKPLKEELQVIQAEVARLLSIYSANRSFGGYARRFLGVLDALLGTPTASLSPDELSPRALNVTERIALSKHALDGSPIPPDLALHWALSADGVSLRTPAKRCASEFLELFRHRYRHHFGTGFVPQTLRRSLRLTYRAASNSLSGEVELDAGLPDVSTSGRNKLLQLIEDCTVALEPYSRIVGRTEGAGPNPLIAAAVLPSEIAGSRTAPELTQLRRLIDSQLVASEFAEVEASDLLRMWPPAQDGKLTRSEAVLLAQMLQNLGYGIEPDVRFGGPALKSGKVICFREPSDSPTAPSPSYATAEKLLLVSVAVANADGTVFEAESAHIEEQIEGAFNLPPAEQRRLRAHLRWLFCAAPKWSSIRKELADLPEADRRSFADQAIAVALADGHVSPEELKLLSKLFPVLGLPEGEVYSRVHQFAATAPSDDPVTVASAHPTPEFQIPPPPATDPTPATAGVELDMARIQRKLTETAAVSSLLGGIFEEQTQAAPPQSPELPKELSAFKSLDVQHGAFLALLAARSEWPRADVESLAARSGLMPDGALELINEAGWDVCGAAVWDGEDPIVIDASVVQELRA